MLKILDSSEARQQLLSRADREDGYPSELLADLERRFGEGTRPEQAVNIIIDSVRQQGDAAIRRWTEELDQVSLEGIRIPPDSIHSATRNLATNLQEALAFAIDRVREFHEQQPIPNWSKDTQALTFGQILKPVESVGVYVPGGSAPLLSSLYMSVIPAQVAGVEKIIVCTPPEVDPALLAVAQMLGLEEIYSIGGAQAIAAMAFGTESVPAVDLIAGAGNLFVTLAKKAVFGVVGIDGLAGPTETLILADKTADSDWIAADLLAQAEHDPLASAILISDSVELAERVQRAAEDQVKMLSRRAIIERSLQGQGGIVLVEDMLEGIELANLYAPEHLCLVVENVDALFPQVNNAGCVFLGEHSYEVLGDYVAGPSHVLPTGGSARFASPLNVFTFLKITSFMRVNPGAGFELSRYAREIAKLEQLSAHAQSASLRIGEGSDES